MKSCLSAAWHMFVTGSLGCEEKEIERLRKRKERRGWRSSEGARQIQETPQADACSFRERRWLGFTSTCLLLVLASSRTGSRCAETQHPSHQASNQLAPWAGQDPMAVQRPRSHCQHLPAPPNSNGGGITEKAKKPFPLKYYPVTKTICSQGGQSA